MRKAVALFLIVFLGLVQPAGAFTLDAIPGSLIYPTQPKTKLKKAPVGSLLTHEFQRDGFSYTETYRVGPKRELQLLSRKQRSGTR
ncbi:hypothetical protein D3C80_601890 [compost metagenome]